MTFKQLNAGWVGLHQVIKLILSPIWMLEMIVLMKDVCFEQSISNFSLNPLNTISFNDFVALKLNAKFVVFFLGRL